MRKLYAAIAIATSVSVALLPIPTFAQAPVTPAGVANDSLTLFNTTVRAFPSAGEPLKMAIADLVVQHPEYAADFAMYVRTEPLPPLQKEAVEEGLADGLKQLGILAQGAPGEPPPSGINPILVGLGVAGAIGGIAYAISQNNKSTTNCVTVSCN
jgi:hypothetical protein